MAKSVVIFGMSGVNGGEKPFGRDFSHSIHPLTFSYFLAKVLALRLTLKLAKVIQIKNESCSKSNLSWEA